MAVDNLRKYPRTKHLPWSEGATNDDKILKSTDNFVGKVVVVTEKMDGENTTMYRDAIHARSLDSANHPSRNWVKQYHAAIKHMIPLNGRVCGENMYATHSIEYRNLVSYFYGFSVWEDDYCLAWEPSVQAFHSLGMSYPKVLYHGVYDERNIQSLMVGDGHMEGYVVRLANGFMYDDFSESVAKYVRANHVTTDEYWMNAQMKRNTLVYG